jgi:hypothetical protein
VKGLYVVYHHFDVDPGVKADHIIEVAPGEVFYILGIAHPETKWYAAIYRGARIEVLEHDLYSNAQPIDDTPDDHMKELMR